ncbi:hypothetical protein DLAC_08504 [Tieghemostelium lacteum]|uniref:Uncharacterized protein n=1 Tax=Tieghemostelium lacteum TaxID=361077 RepID=A0A151Z7J3_TIELA|nr:hypothetical protein DLAC_08504 [Tieghemostelium lacteum]|eukprot:KYQ89933.1 hypothetical protein DLAC_08504 [Tieghemostelium lacteum]
MTSFPEYDNYIQLEKRFGKEIFKLPIKRKQVHYDIVSIDLKNPKMTERYKYELEYVKNISSPYYKSLDTLDYSRFLSDYYSVLDYNEPMLSIGYIFLIGLQNSGKEEVLEKLLGVKLLIMDEVLKYQRPIVFRCRKSKVSSQRYFEFFDEISVRSNNRLYNIDLVRDILLQKSSDYMYPQTFESLKKSFIELEITSDHFECDSNIVYFPSFQSNSVIREYNNKLATQILNFSSEIEFKQKSFILCYNTDRSRDINDDLVTIEKIDPMFTSTFGIFSYTDAKHSKIDKLRKQPPIQLTHPYMELESSSNSQVMEKVVKLYLTRNKENLITFFKEKQEKLEHLKHQQNQILNGDPKLYQRCRDRLFKSITSPLQFDAIQLQMVLRKTIEYYLTCQLNSILREYMVDMLVPGQQIPRDPIDPSTYLSPSHKSEFQRFIQGFSNFDDLESNSENMEKAKHNSIPLNSILSYSDIRSDWLTLSKKSQVENVIKFYGDSEKELVENFIFLPDRSEFHEGWLCNYRNIFSQLLGSDLIQNNQVPSILLKTVLQYVDSIDTSKYPSDFKQYITNQFRSTFTNYIEQQFDSKSHYTTLIQKELIPSLTYQEFRLNQIQEFKSKNHQILAYSFEWNYIYYLSVIKRISEEMNRVSNILLIQPLFEEVFKKSDLSLHQSKTSVYSQREIQSTESKLNTIQNLHKLINL